MNRWTREESRLTGRQELVKAPDRDADRCKVERGRNWSSEDEFGCVIPLTVRQFSTADLREILDAIAKFGWTRATVTEDRASGHYYVAARGCTDAVRKLVMALPADPAYRDGLLKRLNRAEFPSPIGTVPLRSAR